ncbi:DEAD/DEAH box helicase [Galactobacter caseinivorans]|uniref:Helicase SNF2 n=1 Tax=Galactobacter caseinivorans TaxID=2676123 RepID=A0A496PHF1_9MICC|nr:DEAD/DEAH box helicase [Galactobacter caseinivorans]RKW69916.1 hypothetical protein DWQ67_10625 [Galactobacter caseinivorans]
MNPVLERLQVTDVVRAVGTPTLQRARSLVRMVRITRRAPQEGPATVMATVLSTHDYQTMVQLSEGTSGVKIVGNCSCPVTHQCKHAAAVCLVLIDEKVALAAGNTLPDDAGSGPAPARAGGATGVRDEPADPRLWELLDAQHQRGRGYSTSGFGLPDRREQWEVDVQNLVHQLSAASGTESRESAALALELELDPTPSRYGGPLAVTARPLKVGKKKGWIKTGASWAEVCSPFGRGGLDEDQRSALEAVGDALGGPSSAAMERALDHATPRIWSALTSARKTGITLLGGGALESFEVAEEPAEVAIKLDAANGAHANGSTGRGSSGVAQIHDAARNRDSARGAGVPRAHDESTVLQLGVSWQGQLYSGRDVIPLGRRAHGALVLLPGERPGQKRGVLVRLDRMLDEGLSHTLRAGRSTTIPGTGRSKLVDKLLPQLTRHVKVETQDAALRAAIPAKPTLLTRVTWQGQDAALVEFLMKYMVGAREELAAVGTASTRAPTQASTTAVAQSADASRQASAAPGTGSAASSGTEFDAARRLVRDPAAEARALAAWNPGDAAREVLTFSGGRPVAAQRVTGAPMVRLVHEVLPQLRAAGEVREVGAEPAFQRLDGDPEIRFEVGEPPAGGTDWLDLSVKITVDGEPVPLAEVLAALTLQEPVILLASGSYVDAEHPALTQLARMVEEAQGVRRGGKNASAAGTVQVAAGDLALWEMVDKLGETDAAAARWVETARALRAPERMPAVEPVGVLTELRDYQREGLNWLHYLYSQGLGGILADDMGLGKTLQVISLISLARADGSEPFLVIAPTSVVGAWQRQVATHAPHLKVRAITNTIKRRKLSLGQVAQDADIVVTSYNLLRSEAADYADLGWGGLILDEAQAIKNAASKTFQAARKIQAPFSLAVTGTPVENRIGELWPLLAVVAPGLYPTLESFTRLVITPVEKKEDQEAMLRLRRRIRPFLLRRTKALVASALPPKQEQVLQVALDKSHRHFYDALLQRERQEVLGLVEELDQNRVAVFAAITRLRMGSLHAGLVDEEYSAVESAKIAELVPRLIELAQEGHRALVFSQFTSFLKLIREAVHRAGLETVYLDGSTRDRAGVLDQFAEGDAPVFLISLKAGGVGLTLTEADYVFIMDPWWNPAVEAQAVDRTHRIGQERPVMVYRMVAEDTIEGKVMALKERKAELFDQLVGTAQSTPQALSEADLRELFAG